MHTPDEHLSHMQWIEKNLKDVEKTSRALPYVLACGCATATGLYLWNHTLGWALFLLTAITWVVGTYMVHVRKTDFEQQRRQLLAHTTQRSPNDNA
jgi:hypothetical protein